MPKIPIPASATPIIGSAIPAAASPVSTSGLFKKLRGFSSSSTGGAPELVGGVEVCVGVLSGSDVPVGELDTGGGVGSTPPTSAAPPPVDNSLSTIPKLSLTACLYPVSLLAFKLSKSLTLVNFESDSIFFLVWTLSSGDSDLNCFLTLFSLSTFAVSKSSLLEFGSVKSFPTGGGKSLGSKSGSGSGAGLRVQVLLPRLLFVL